MDPLLVLSPHLDDAVLSVGQFLAGRGDVTVATVCTATPVRRRQLTSFDQACGFPSASAAVRVRRNEDLVACQRVGATAMHLGCTDSQYLGNAPDSTMHQAVRDAAEQVLGPAPEGGRVLLAPLGLAHPDHLRASAMALAVAAELSLQLWLYEELPARVLWPELVPERLARVAACGRPPVLDFLGTGPLHVKDHAVRAYASQVPALSVLGHWPHTVLVPERLWRCDPA